MDEKEVLRKIQNYAYCEYMLREINEQLESLEYKITVSYGEMAAGGGGFNSKVERLGNKRYELESKAEKYKREIKEISKYIKCSGLNRIEQRLMIWLALNKKLQAFARVERIGRNNVYKIRDRALSKIVAVHGMRNEV